MGAAACTLSGALAACGGAPAAPGVGVGVCGGQTGVASARTPGYVVVLMVGPPETAAAAAAASPSPSPSAAAEVVLSGTMASATGPGGAHLELHICTRSTGAVASGIHPAVTLMDVTTNSAAEPMAVAVMEGVGQGLNDLHYGNNVDLKPGDMYAIAVHIDAGDSTVLRYQAPAAGPVQTPGPPSCLVNHQLC